MFRLHSEGGRHGDKDVDRGCVNIVDVDNGLLGGTNKGTNELDYSYNRSNTTKHKIDRLIDTYSLNIAVDGMVGVASNMALDMLIHHPHGRMPRRLVCLAPI